RSLRSGIGGARAIGRVLREDAFGTERSIHLVSRDRMKMDLRKPSCHLEERTRSLDIGLEEASGVADAPVDMRLCGKMHESIDLVLFAEGEDELLVADVSLLEQIARVALAAARGLGIRGVCESIEVDDERAGRAAGESPADERRPDKPRASR